MQNLNLYNATLTKEKTYFTFVLVISIIVWLLLVFTIFPIFYALLAFIAIWFGNGLLVAQLKADGIKVHSEQLPELDHALREVCAKLEVQQVPELYIVESGGILNAFATRHSGRNFVVINSDLLEAYGPSSPEIKFLLGHELGHIKQKHIIKQLFLFPGLLVPLLGNAYSRACEASCDRFGALASNDIDASINAMMILSGGKAVSKIMNPVSFAAQYLNIRGFFVSWYELISGYPTFSQRVAHLLSVRDGQSPARSPRNPLAYLFAFFTIGGRGTGGANLLITVAVIGLLAAIAIPSFVKARDTAQQNACINNMRQIDSAKEQWGLMERKNIGDAVDINAVNKYIKGGVSCPAGGNYAYKRIGEDPECSVHGTLTDAIPNRY
jgi:Zn-dependent protease with chaperone function/competence protein ComGC